MRKLFRFKYESCNGTCYAWCHHLIIALRTLSDNQRKELVNLMVNAHNKLCDNSEYSFGLDSDDKGFFVAYFRTPNKTDLYSGMDFSKVVHDVCNSVINTDIPIVSGTCIFGNNGQEDLGNEILKYCNDFEFNKLEERNCECKSYII